MRRIIKTWWPLAASWLLMAVEVPVLSAVMARLANPEIHLAAYGGVVNPISVLIEAPIIMLLAASTALSKDWAAYQRLRRFMWVSSALLTALHMLVAFTPLYYVVAQSLLGMPPETLEPARVGLMLMTPWTASIAYRRFQQGVMIRFGHSEAVGTGTLVRLIADGLGLMLGYQLGLPGIVVAAGSQSLGVISEAVYAGWRVNRVLEEQLKPAPPAGELTWGAFARFYIPLALTSLLSFVWPPIGSAALSRMPQALQSLAVWPVVSGLVFMLRSFGLAYNEVVVARLDEPASSAVLRRFTLLLAASATLLHLLIAATPLAGLWFQRISALPPALASLAHTSFWIALPLPALSVLQSWYQGAILHGRRTAGIPESVAIFLFTLVVVLAVGVSAGRFTGVYVSMVGYVLANVTQTFWLWIRSRAVMRSVQIRDSQPVGLDL